MGARGGFILPVWRNPVLPQDDEYRVSGTAGASVSVENPEVSDAEAVSGMPGDGDDSRQCVPDLQWDSDEKSGLSLLQQPVSFAIFWGNGL